MLHQLAVAETTSTVTNERSIELQISLNNTVTVHID
jgi:hypothetical protein